MVRAGRWTGLAELAAAAAFAVALAGCSMFGGGKDLAAASASTAKSEEAAEIDVRRYLGPDYCPELRIPEGAEILRKFDSGYEDDGAGVVWQASIGRTARECLYDLENNLTLRIGVAGRLISGPKGGAGAVTLPLRIAVVKHEEAVLFSELYPVSVTLPPQGSTAFTDVREVVVPSPGTNRDYILYVALSEKEIDWLDPTKEPEVAIVEEPVIEEEPAAAPPPKQTPRELPVPTGGFVLGQ